MAEPSPITLIDILLDYHQDERIFLEPHQLYYLQDQREASNTSQAANLIVLKLFQHYFEPSDLGI